jgi:hypothetical protein
VGELVLPLGKKSVDGVGLEGAVSLQRCYREDLSRSHFP